MRPGPHPSCLTRGMGPPVMAPLPALCPSPSPQPGCRLAPSSGAHQESTGGTRGRGRPRPSARHSAGLRAVGRPSPQLVPGETPPRANRTAPLFDGISTSARSSAASPPRASVLICEMGTGTAPTSGVPTGSRERRAPGGGTVRRGVAGGRSHSSCPPGRAPLSTCSAGSAPRRCTSRPPPGWRTRSWGP